jgi:hypothetical protein
MGFDLTSDHQFQFKSWAEEGTQPMPTPERGTRSAAIREFLKTNPTTASKDVIAALHENGIEVSESLVHKIKYRSARKRAKIRRKSASTSGHRHQAVVSKSESIRNFLRRNPNATPTVVRTGLRKEGVKVTTGLISNVAFYFRKKTAAPRVKVAARRAQAKMTRKKSATATRVTIEQLLEVKRFADSFGGADQIRQALATLEQLR